MPCESSISDEVRLTLDAATEHHLAGRLGEAEPLYRAVIARSPDHPDALHRLGVLIWQNGNASAALALVERAAQINPAEARYHCSRGQLLAAADQLPQSVAAFQRALELNPDLVEALFGLGVALQATGQPDQAIPVYRQAIGHRPDHVEAHNNLGNALQSA